MLNLKEVKVTRSNGNIVRRIDDLGRVVIPKEIRRSNICNLGCGMPCTKIIYIQKYCDDFLVIFKSNEGYYFADVYEESVQVIQPLFIEGEIIGVELAQICNNKYINIFVKDDCGYKVITFMLVFNHHY